MQVHDHMGMSALERMQDHGMQASTLHALNSETTQHMVRAVADQSLKLQQLA